MCIRLVVLLMWGVGGMQSMKFAAAGEEVVEALSNYRKSSFWWFGNPACCYSTGSTQTEKDKVCAPLRPAWEKRGESTVWFSVSGALLNDWANGGYVDVLFTCGECSFSSLESWFCSEERVWDWVTKDILNCFKEVRCQQVDALGI